MSQQKWAKIMAILALAGIIISIVWTWILYIVERNNQERELKNMIEKYTQSNSWTINIWTWKIEINSWTIDINWEKK